MSDLRIGVIGVGGRGALAKQAHRPGEGSRLVAGADVNPKALKAFGEFVGDDVKLFEDYRQLLECKDIDAVFVTSPDFLHEEQAVASLDAGKHVYLEKPMAITIEGCDRILDAARRVNRKLYLGHNMRHFPVVLKMKELIDGGVIGEMQAVWCRHFVSYGGDAYFKDWHSERRYATGLLLQKAAHDIDVIHWLAGGYTSRVSGMGKLSVYDRCQRRSSETSGCADWKTENWPPLSQINLSPEIDVEDHTMIMMQLDNGVQASYMQCHYTADSERNYTFIGTEGRIENYGDYGNCEVVVFNQRGCTRHRPDMVVNLREKAGSHGGSDPDIVDTFIRYITEDAPINTSPIAARNAVAAGVMATESLRSDSGLREIPPLSQDLIDYFER